MNRTDIELFKSLLQDDSIHITLAKVIRVTPTKDRSAVFLECVDQINGNDLICTMTWDSVGDNTASGDLPDEEDLYIVAYSNSNYNQGFALKRLASKDEQLPKQITEDKDHAVMAKPGKALHLTSDTRINVGLGDYDNPPTEPLLLGNVVKSLFSDMLTQLAQLSGDVKDLADKTNDLAGQVSTLANDVATHVHPTAAPGPPSPPVTAPAFVATGTQATLTGTEASMIGSDADGVKSELEDLKSSPVQDEAILSDLAFTEKGGS